MITFVVFGPQSAAPSSCSPGGTTVGTATASGNATYNPSAHFTPSGAGDYWWYASYGGDTNNDPAASTCGAGMAETVVSASASPASISTPYKVTSRPAPHVGVIGRPRFNGKALLVKLACAASGSSCKGKITLRYNATLMVGAVRYSIRAGHSATITVTLNHNGVTLLKPHHKLAVKGTVTLVQQNGRSKTAIRFKTTLKPKKKRPLGW
jgi:hypothetical protein